MKVNNTLLRSRSIILFFLILSMIKGQKNNDEILLIIPNSNHKINLELSKKQLHPNSKHSTYIGHFY